MMGLLKCLRCKNCHCNCPPGPPGPQGPQGQGSTLFFSDEQGPGNIVIPAEANDFTIMDVQVTTTVPNERVKLDASMTVEVAALITQSFFQFGVQFLLLRNINPLTVASQFGNYVRQINNQGFYDWHPNFTFVDIPGAPGTYTYRVAVFEIEQRINVNQIIAANRGLTATVYPPV
jgi:hypothetical protein